MQHMEHPAISARWSPPLRSRKCPFQISGLTEVLLAKVRSHSEILCRHLDLKDGVLSCNGRGTTEHPVDPGKDPYPSIFVCRPFRALAAKHMFKKRVFDQCMHGAATRKRTQIDGVLEKVETLGSLCCHDFKHAPSKGFDEFGQFHSANTANYPSAMCRDLAKLFVGSFGSATACCC